MRSALLDGVLAVVLPDGTTASVTVLKARAGGARSELAYFVLDVLYLDGKSLAPLPLEERKRRCRELLNRQAPGSPLRYSEHFERDGSAVLRHACALGARGIVSKRRDAPHRPGRNDDWLETCCAATSARSAVPKTPLVLGVSITTPERPVYPELGFTKLDLAKLYARLAPWMLPHVANRPLTLVRCEKGVRRADALRSECRFLRHEPGWHRWVKDPIGRVQIQEQRKIGEYLVIDSAEGLVALVQGDILEIHVWSSRVDQLERPDRMVFDLDPGADVVWTGVQHAARLLRDELAGMGLDCWPKLTGGKGLHVVVPFAAVHGWDAVYALSRRIADAVVRKDPATLTLGFGKQGRTGRILLDYKRNHRAAVAVAAYSARARPTGAVGVPISWRELQASSGPDRWTVQNVLSRLTRLRRDPWEGFWTARQELPLAAARGAR